MQFVGDLVVVCRAYDRFMISVLAHRSQMQIGLHYIIHLRFSLYATFTLYG